MVNFYNSMFSPGFADDQLTLIQPSAPTACYMPPVLALEDKRNKFDGDFHILAPVQNNAEKQYQFTVNGKVPVITRQCSFNQFAGSKSDIGFSDNDDIVGSPTPDPVANPVVNTQLLNEDKLIMTQIISDIAETTDYGDLSHQNVVSRPGPSLLEEEEKYPVVLTDQHLNPQHVTSDIDYDSAVPMARSPEMDETDAMISPTKNHPLELINGDSHSDKTADEADDDDLPLSQ